MNGKQFLQNFNCKFLMQKINRNIFTTNYFGLSKFDNSTVYEITFPENASIVMQRNSCYYDKFTSSEIIIKNVIPFHDFKNKTFWPNLSYKQYYYSTFDILHIPYDNIDENIAYIHFMQSKQLNFIPSHLITKEMSDYYFNLNDDILQIPEKHLDFEMCEKYFLKTKFLKGIPSYYRKELIQKYL